MAELGHSGNNEEVRELCGLAEAKEASLQTSCLDYLVLG